MDPAPPTWAESSVCFRLLGVRLIGGVRSDPAPPPGLRSNLLFAGHIWAVLSLGYAWLPWLHQSCQASAIWPHKQRS